MPSDGPYARTIHSVEWAEGPAGAVVADFSHRFEAEPEVAGCLSTPTTSGSVVS
jgi:hypothetical protein